jgi:hypothetical protein
VRKYASTTVQNLGATKDKKDIHDGRWKLSMHVLDFYNDVELPFPDVKLAGLLCPGGPVCYAIMTGANVCPFPQHSMTCGMNTKLALVVGKLPTILQPKNALLTNTGTTGGSMFGT